MNGFDSQYAQLLEMKLDSLKNIYKTEVEQSYAIEKKNQKLIRRLLKRQKKNLDNLHKIIKALNLTKDYDKQYSMLDIEKEIDILAKNTYNLCKLNISKATELKDEMGGKVKNLKLGKNAMQNGYFKKIPIQQGYYIDKKIGTKDRGIYKKSS